MEKNYTVLNDEKLPATPGYYLAKGIWGSKGIGKIEVYEHSEKGLCCFSQDIGKEARIRDIEESHIPIQNTGLEFITRIEKI